MNPDAFMEIHDWGGHIGNIWWVNSEPSPHRCIFRMVTVIFWGAVIFGTPKEGISYGETKVLNP